MFPILFGAPSFGSEDRDQWIRVLQLFLQDPFTPHAVNVGGETQVRYGWTVPGAAVQGNAPDDRYNNYNIREYNPFPSATTVNPGDQPIVSDRPGLLFVFGYPNNNFGLFMCGYDPYDFSGNVQLLLSGDEADFEVSPGVPGRFCCFWDSTHRKWRVENNFPETNQFYMAFMSLGAQV